MSYLGRVPAYFFGFIAVFTVTIFLYTRGTSPHSGWSSPALITLVNHTSKHAGNSTSNKEDFWTKYGNMDTYNMTQNEKNLALWKYWNTNSHGDLMPFNGGRDFRNKFLLIESADFYVGADLEHWLPDWYGQPDIGTVLSTRVGWLQQRCQTYQGHRNKWLLNVFLAHSNSTMLGFCPTAKAGSSFWKAVIQELIAREQYINVSSEPAAGQIQMTTVRNPWHRLVSTYLDKFHSPTIWKESSRKICKIKLASSLNWRPSFKWFIQSCVLSNWKRGIHNIHWMPSTERCDICSGSFDFVVAVENMMLEGAYVLSKIGIQNPENLLQKIRNGTIRPGERQQLSKNYQEYYETLDFRDLTQLQDLFARDIFILEYPHSPFVDFIRS